MAKGRFHEAESMTRKDAWVDSLEVGPNLDSSSPRASWSRQLASGPLFSQCFRTPRLSIPPAEFLVGKSVHRRIRMDMTPSFSSITISVFLRVLCSSWPRKQKWIVIIKKQYCVDVTYEGLGSLWQRVFEINGKFFAMSSSSCFTWCWRPFFLLLHEEGVQHFVRPAECFVCEMQKERFTTRRCRWIATHAARSERLLYSTPVFCGRTDE